MEIVYFILILIIVGLALFLYINKKNNEKQKLSENMKKDEEMRENAKKELKEIYEKLKLDYSTNGLPIIKADNMILSKNETCHYTSSADFGKIKTITAGYQGGSRGVSLRIMKGVSYRVGNFKGHVVRNEIIESTKGIIFLTNKKIIFSAPKNSCTIMLNKITTLDTYKEYIQVQTENKNYLFKVSNNLEFLVILETLINQK